VKDFCVATASYIKSLITYLLTCYFMMFLKPAYFNNKLPDSQVLLDLSLLSTSQVTKDIMCS